MSLQDERLQELMDGMRGRFKALTAMLGLQVRAGCDACRWWCFAVFVGVRAATGCGPAAMMGLQVGRGQPDFHPVADHKCW